MRKWMRRAVLGLGIATVTATLVLGASVVRFRSSLPDYSGTAAAAGLSSPVEIYRDAHAIPHIIAHSRADALFGLGYAQAQDRLWQMVFLRRVLQGRLAESIGAQGIPTDTFMRTLGLYRLSEQSLDHMKPETRKLLDAYAAGINAYLDAHKGQLPVEFALMGVSPEPWRAADSVVIFKYMQMMLSGNMYDEIERVRLSSHLSKRQIEDLYPPYPGDPDNPLPDYLNIFASTKSAALEIPDTKASNNWVVSGSRSATGAPLLANDPHLALTIPSIWYLAHISYPGQDVVGGVLPGIPGITLGRNRTTAWGATNTGPDTQDLYLEKLTGPSSNSYVTPTGNAAFDSRRETINVRFGEPIVITIRTSRHGPVLPATWPRIKGLVPKGYVLALAWSALVPDDTTIQANMEIDTSSDALELTGIVKDYVSPMQNLVHAHRDGHIGLILASRVPIRSQDNDSLGLVPAKGWEASYDWTGNIPGDKLPRVDDPASGQIATANNKTVPPNYPYVLTREWADPFRIREIDKLLSATTKHSVASFEAIQLDTHDAYAEELLPLLLKAGKWPSEDGAKAAALLSKWDTRMDADRPEPLIFEAWQRMLVKRLIADELGPDFKPYWTHNAVMTLRVLKDVAGESRWCDDVRTKAVEDCPYQVRMALADALSDLRKTYGSDMSKWRWGDAHHAIFAHQPFDQFPVLDRIFNREVETSGGAFTIRRADFRYSASRPFAATHGSGYRAIYDLGMPDNSRYMITTGESGNVFSAYYDDMMPLWADGKYVRIPTSPDEIKASAKYHLTLYPASGTIP